jgi:serine/threonine-protein kinase
MPLSPGTTLGPYSVTAKIGEGGMGEVYRARDTKLDRDVALKVLPQAFTDDPDRLARFEREAKVLASLNHTNIGHIYGLEEAEGQKALVLELVEGPTLADRIAQGPIPLDEALPIAKQIAEALEVAHEQGIIHRDLKPANVKVKDDGTVKVLDFGLAKAFQADASDASLSMSPTISLTAAATQMGMVIGTAAYMAPEQAKGKPVDKRADVWAFGAVLYEMLTGQKPFSGDDVSTTLARVIEREPDWDTLPGNLSPVLATYLRRCLAKEPKQRVHDIADVRLAMEGAFDTEITASLESTAAPQLQVWQRPIPSALGALMLIVVSGLAVWSLTRPDVVPSDLMRFTIVPPDAASLDVAGLRNDLEISHDGTQLVYKASTPSGVGANLHLQPLSQLVGVPLRGGEGGSGPFFSANGEWVGFVDDSTGTILQKVSILGGPPVKLTESPDAILGATWGIDDQIIFGRRETGLFRVSGGGGEPEPLTTPDTEQGEVGHHWPSTIPDREAVVFVVSTGLPLLTGQLAVLDLATGDVTRLGLAGVSPRYVSTGHLVYGAEDGSVYAVPFDAASLEVTGNPVPLLEGVVTKVSGAADFSISDNGRLVYVLGSSFGMDQQSLVWVDREGREEPIRARPGGYIYPRISPDGSRVALDARGEDNGLWIWDFAQETLIPITVDGPASYPVWMPGGERIAYESDSNLYWKASNNTGTPELLVEALGSVESGNPSPYFFTPEGTALVFRDQNHPETGDDLRMISLEEPADPIWHLTGDFNERNAELSPNGHWMAYQSDESGEFQIYVRPFPQVDDDKELVSNNGGFHPLWSRDGRELFYVQPGTPQLISVSVETNETDEAFAFGDRETILNWPYFAPAEGRNYDVSPNGQRFLTVKLASAEGETDAMRPEITVVLNWFQELTERVPVP